MSSSLCILAFQWSLQELHRSDSHSHSALHLPWSHQEHFHLSDEQQHTQLTFPPKCFGLLVTQKEQILCHLMSSAEVKIKVLVYLSINIFTWTGWYNEYLFIEYRGSISTLNRGFLSFVSYERGSFCPCPGPSCQFLCPLLLMEGLLQ